MKLKISNDLSLPLDFITATQAILAIKRVGKSYTASVQAEELLKAGQQIVAIDVTGAWWGLRSNAAGDGPGFPVVIFGGDHGDIALEEGAGEVLAEAIVTERFSAIIDLSLFRKGQAQRFLAVFFETLYRRNREAMHIFMDEADFYAPQKPFGEEARTLGAVNDIVRRGGIRGIGCTLITQRASVLNKDVLTQAGIVTALRISHPRDMAAILEWVDVHSSRKDAQAMMAALPSLPIGEAFIWAPGWPTEKGIFERIKIRQRETFNSGATPKAGHVIRQPKVMASLDIQKLGQQIVQTVQRQKENDPKELKAKIRQLEMAAKERKPEFDEDCVKAAVQQALERQRAEHNEILRGIVLDDQRLRDGITSAAKALNNLMDVGCPVPVGGLQVIDRPVMIARALHQPKAAQVRFDPVPRQVRPAGASNGDTTLSGGACKLLGAMLAYPEGINRGQAKILCGFAERTMTNYVSELNVAGLISKNGRVLQIPRESIERARGLAGAVAPPADTDEVLALWRPRLSGGAVKLLDALVATGKSIRRDSVQEITGFADRTLTNYVSELSVAGLLVKPGQGLLAANREALFL